VGKPACLTGRGLPKEALCLPKEALACVGVMSSGRTNWRTSFTAKLSSAWAGGGPAKSGTSPTGSSSRLRRLLVLLLQAAPAGGVPPGPSLRDAAAAAAGATGATGATAAGAAADAANAGEGMGRMPWQAMLACVLLLLLARSRGCCWHAMLWAMSPEPVEGQREVLRCARMLAHSAACACTFSCALVGQGSRHCDVPTVAQKGGRGCRLCLLLLGALGSRVIVTARSLFASKKPGNTMRSIRHACRGSSLCVQRARPGLLEAQGEPAGGRTLRHIVVAHTVHVGRALACLCTRELEAVRVQCMQMHACVYARTCTRTRCACTRHMPVPSPHFVPHPRCPQLSAAAVPSAHTHQRHPAHTHA